ncbi:helix-turn-helix domain-containing protein [Chitinophaga qingshengii]|uniref:Helix-turn-helix domain-containing protein n=1 Tax=Chitinophaga qingshengii TaxID=1569794 RepID=A0ABR7TPE1_9BACT|nr:helix-turn-helix domain-containing protein [Chitinophaga qingshengii]MBC9932348.1 helix-turn-helix domain-containing protein [Chitinophaga qingshengii]
MSIKGLRVWGIEKIFNLPYKQEDFKLLQHEPINSPVIEEAHKHDFFMLLMVGSKGSGTHTIDFRDYKVAPRTVFFLAPGQAHQWNLSPHTNGYQVMFSGSFMLQKGPLWPFFTPSATPVLKLSAEQYTQLAAELQLMVGETAANITQHRLQVILLLLQRWYAIAYPTETAASGNRLINRFLQLLEKQYAQHSEVNYYAARLHVTASYLNTVCKKESGTTAGEYIRERLLLEAKRLLILTDMDVKEIAFSLGFNDTSYFSRFFRKYTTQTPVDFRRHADHL